MFVGVHKILVLVLVLSGSYLLNSGLGTITIANVISGTRGLNKFGPSTVNLSAINTFTGNVAVYGGALALTGTGSLGSGTFAGNIANNGTFVYATGAPQTLSGVLSGAGAIKVNGSSLFTLSGANTCTGPISITNSSTLSVSSDANTGTSNTLIDTGGTLKVSANGYTLGSTKTITIGSSGGTINDSTGTFNKAINFATNGQLLGSGTITIFGSSSQTDVISIRAYQALFTGAITISSGRLEITTTDPGTGGNYLIGTGNITITAGTLAFAADTTPQTGSNTIQNNISVQGSGDGTGSLHSKSSGNTTFTGTVTMTANTTIANDSGTPGFMVFTGVVSGAFTLTVNTPVEFDAVNTFSTLTMGGGRTIRGTGTIPSVSIASSASSVIEGGTSATSPGTLTVSGNLTMVGSLASVSVGSNGTTTLSQITVTGTCALGGCKVNLLNTMSAGTYNLIVATGTMSGTLPVIGTNSSGRTATFAQSGNTLTVTLV